MNLVIRPAAHRILTTLLLVLGILAISYALLGMYNLGIANASAAGFADPAALPAATMDPIVTAQATIDSGMVLLTQYGPIWGGALLAFGLGSWLMKRNEVTHWIAQGRVFAMLTGIVSVVGAVFAWHFNGADFGGVVVSLIMAIKLIMSPETVAKAA